MFVDLADPEKRNHADIRHAMELLSRFEKQVDVILGLNLKESGEICDVLGIPICQRRTRAPGGRVPRGGEDLSEAPMLVAQFHRCAPLF